MPNTLSAGSNVLEKSAQRDTLATHARAAFGMRAWIADAYADIATSVPPDNHSATATLRACSELSGDDSGSVDPLTTALAGEILRLNNLTMASQPNNDATMHLLLDALGLQEAEPEEKRSLLLALGTYLENHDFSDDHNFKTFAAVVDALNTSASPE